MLMPKGKNQKMKLYRLYEIMLHETDEDHALTIKQIQERLAACDITADRKTLYEDLTALQDLGLQVEMSREGNEFGYHVTKKRFELAELKLLVDAIQSSRFITAKKSKQLINKLTDYTSTYEARQLNRQVIVAGRIKTMNESIYYNVDAIHRAIGENRQIVFRYLQWNENRELVPRRTDMYRVSPWALTWDGGNYYLLAYETEADIIKTYRVDKMDRITVTEARREGKTAFGRIDMAVYTKENFSMYAGEETMVRLRFDKSLIGVMIDRFGRDIPIHQTDGDCLETVVQVGVSGMFYGWIFGLGRGVQIIKPAEVRDEYARRLRERAEMYGV